MKNIKNKKAYFEYFIEDTYEAGVVLKGSEVKSCRASKVQLLGSFCKFFKGELYMVDVHISKPEGSVQSYQTHEEKDMRKLLLHKKELKKLQAKLVDGRSIVPLEMYLTNKGKIKVKIALVKGKALHDKRQTIKERDIKRSMKESKYD